MTALATTEAPIHLGDITVQFLLTPDESDASVSIFRCDMRAGARMPAPHSHDAFDETIQGLRGIVSMTVAGERIDVEPGDVLFIPRGTIHGFDVGDDADASMLCTVTPGVFGPSYFTDLRDVVAAGGPPDLAAIMGVMQRHGLTPAAPA
jgi:quercetin dioxygenase-like cupin family protein